jgi:RimJ/RimL family protein N-acetyltransferase
MEHEYSFPHVIATPWLALRRYSASDADDARALVSENRAHLMQSFPEMARGLSQPEEVSAFLDEKAAQWNAGRAFCYGIWGNQSQALIGQIQAKNIEAYMDVKRPLRFKSPRSGTAEGG